MRQPWTARTECQGRLPLSLDLDSGAPARARITPGQRCERAVWRGPWEAGQAWVGDGYYGEPYRAFAEMDQLGMAFVVRVRDQTVVEVEEELPLSEADRAAGVVRSAWVRLGDRPELKSLRLRMIWVATLKGLLRLVTHLGPEELSAGEVALRYRQRWQIELFFRWLKGTLDCRHWLAESAEGVAIQVHLALIAVLLLLLGGGGTPPVSPAGVGEFGGSGRGEGTGTTPSGAAPKSLSRSSDGFSFRSPAGPRLYGCQPASG